MATVGGARTTDRGHSLPRGSTLARGRAARGEGRGSRSSRLERWNRRYFLPADEYGAGSIIDGVALFSARENDSASDGKAPARTSET